MTKTGPTAGFRPTNCVVLSAEFKPNNCGVLLAGFRPTNCATKVKPHTRVLQDTPTFPRRVCVSRAKTDRKKLRPINRNISIQNRFRRKPIFQK